MAEIQWNIEEVKRWKIKQLIQYNLGMLVLFAILIYSFEFVQLYFLIGSFYMLVLILAAIALYNLMTGKFVGTKTGRRIQQYEKARLGEKRWKRRKIIEAVFIIGLVILVTAFIFTSDVDTSQINFSSAAFPFIGAWLGYNIGEIVRTRNLKEL